METEDYRGRIEAFLDEVIVGELGKLQGISLTCMHFVLMGQAVEVLGSFLDNKPFKARDQAAKRFEAGINKLFGGRYRLANENNELYQKLRNQMTHTFTPGGGLILLNRADVEPGIRHLDKIGTKWVLVAEDFYEDICRAADRLKAALRENKIPIKRIVY